MPENQMSTDLAYLSFATAQDLKHFALQDICLIGRGADCHIKLDDPNLSERHCKIEKTSEGYRILDLQSKWGLYINGRRKREHILQEGDKVGVTDYWFTFSRDLPQNPLETSKNLHWQKQLALIPNIALSNHPVLLLGESGTGKDLLASQIHELSSRRENPFVIINCSAIAESLIESELFGHLKGSFTGAIQDRKGAFEQAQGGTLFLDEIGELPLHLQAKILRAIENQEIRPIGSEKMLKTNVRIIAATHNNLAQKVRNQQFRLDLYYRLNVVTIHVPALRERMEDFDRLIFSFAKEQRVRFGFHAIETLRKHPWPGNIRELKNLVARASACFPNTQIQEQHIESLLQVQNQVGSFSQDNAEEVQLGSLSLIKELEKKLIIEKLVTTKGNQRKAAIELNLPKSTLHDRIKSYGIKIDEVVKMGAIK